MIVKHGIVILCCVFLSTAHAVVEDIPDMSQQPTAPNALSNSGAVAPALLSEREPGEGLDPETQLERIPLRAPMTDASWKKWAGPALEKLYRLRKGDTLWTVSDRLFGNPYLWPKVWQLNAQLGNPHIVDPGLELEFVPGNPNSAPVLAYKTALGKTGDLAFVPVPVEMSFLEKLDTLLLSQLLSPQPPFREFVLDSDPDVVGRLPKLDVAAERLMYREGDEFELDVDDGTYSVVSLRSLGTARGALSTPFSARKLDWLGVVDVSKGRAKLRKAFQEISPGAELIEEDFSVTPLSLHMADVPEDDAKDFEMTAISSSSLNFPSPLQVAGLRLPSSERGPTGGSVLRFFERGKERGKGLVLKKDGRLATVWIVEADKELDAIDEIR